MFYNHTSEEEINQHTGSGNISLGKIAVYVGAGIITYKMISGDAGEVLGNMGQGLVTGVLVGAAVGAVGSVFVTDTVIKMYKSEYDTYDQEEKTRTIHPNQLKGGKVVGVILGATSCAIALGTIGMFVGGVFGSSMPELVDTVYIGGDNIGT